MNFPKQVKTSRVIFLLISMLVISSVSVYYGLSASTPTSGLTDIYVEPPLMEPSYIIGIYTAPSTCYLKNGTSGEIIITDIFYTVLQAAISYLSVSYGGTGGKILIRGGNYNLTYPIAIGSGDIWFEGEGVGVTTITYGLGTGVMFTYTLSNWYFLGGFKNIYFSGPNTANSYAIKVLGNVSDLTFQDCAFLSFDTAVWLQANAGSGQAKIWNFWFDRCLIEDNIHYGIYFTSTVDTTRMIDRVKISECHFANNLNSVYCDTQFVFHVTFTDNTVQAERQACINITSGGRQWIVTDNHIFDCGIGANGTMAAIMVNGTGTYYADSWLIENNIIANHFTSSPVATNNSIWLTGTVRNFAIQNNYFYVAAEGVRLSGLTLTQDPLLVIKDNVGNYNNTVTSWNMGFGADPSSASYVIFKDSSYYYMMNGTTGKIDYQSTNMTKVLTFAMGNLTSGGKIFIKAGTYNVTTTIYLVNDVWIQGEGKDITILNYIGLEASCTYAAITNAGYPSTLNKNITISDLTLFANQTGWSSGYRGIGFRPVQNVLIQNVRVSNCSGWGISFYGDTTTPSKDCRVINCHVSNCGYDCIEFVGFVGYEFMYGLVQGCTLTHADGGVSPFGAFYLSIIGNMFLSIDGCVGSDVNHIGIPFQSTSAYCTVMGNLFDDSNCTSKYSGIAFLDTGGHHIIIGNIFNFTDPDNQYGYLITGGSPGNIVSDNEFYKMYASASTVGYLEGPDNIFSNNYVNAYSGANYGFRVFGENTIVESNRFVSRSAVYDILRVYGNGSKISGNIFQLASGPGLGIEASNCTVRDNRFQTGSGGISVVSGVNNVVELNEFLNITTPITNTGTNTLIRWNNGYITEASKYTASCINGTEISHSMVATPTVITLTMNGTQYLNSTSWYLTPTVIAQNTTTFTLSLLIFNAGTIVPVAGNYNCTIYWQCQSWNFP